jgi:cytochrome b6-f complex iron-sulfur subunit
MMRIATIFSRRALLALAGRAGAAALAVACAWPVLRFATWRARGTALVRFGPEDLADHAYRDGVYLIRDGGGYAALSARCTHLCCIVGWDPARDRFVCPCHRSEYDARGRRIKGRATRDLDRLPVRELPGGGLEVEVRL